MHGLELKLAMIAFAGIAAQWVAWRLHLPAIALLLLAGLFAGPLTGFVNPAADFGDLYRPIVSFAVAIILFEGGLTLNFSEIRETSKGVRRIILAGPLVWLLGTLAGHFVGGLSWQTATLLGAILVVTGPTVIMPLLRQARLKTRAASLLRWEAIVNDPIGALFAVLSFEVFLVLNNVHNAENLFVNVIAASIIALPGAWLLGRGLVWLFINGHIPEFLKAPVLLTAAIVANALTNQVLEEAGLLTVTVMGITIANSRMASLTEMRRFKETITVILVSAVFILLTASLKLETITSLGLEAAGFVIAILFVVRPLAIFTATIGAGLTWQERLLSALIAPRGIVAVAVAGLFGTTLVEQGIADGEKMIAYTFAVVASTIILHGFSLPFLARLLDLRSSAKPGILLVGGSRWSVAFAEKLQALEIPVMIADSSWNRLRTARSRNLPIFFGDVLSEQAHHELNLSVWGSVITATDNDAYNALVCTEFGPEIGRSNVFQIGKRPNENHHRQLHFTLGGRPLTRPGLELNEFNERMADGWTFRSTTMTSEKNHEHYLEERAEETLDLFWYKPGGRFVFSSITKSGTPGEGAVLVSFGPPKKNAKKPGTPHKGEDAS